MTLFCCTPALTFAIGQTIVVTLLLSLHGLENCLALFTLGRLILGRLLRHLTGVLAIDGLDGREVPLHIIEVISIHLLLAGKLLQICLEILVVLVDLHHRVIG